MAKLINVSFDEMESTISAIGAFANDLSSSTQDFESQVRSLSGRDWNEETGATIDNNLEAASTNIKKLIEQLNEFKLLLEKINENYVSDFESYRNEKNIER